jgi:hypothetical protein
MKAQCDEKAPRQHPAKKELLAELRTWAATRARPASAPETTTVSRARARTLDI